jgi:hypothetical protein
MGHASSLRGIPADGKGERPPRSLFESGLDRVERRETVGAARPSTYQRLAMDPHLLMRGLPTPPKEWSGI